MFALKFVSFNQPTAADVYEKLIPYVPESRLPPGNAREKLI
jgi:hypothetical protein